MGSFFEFLKSLLVFLPAGILLYALPWLVLDRFFPSAHNHPPEPVVAREQARQQKRSCAIERRSSE